MITLVPFYILCLFCLGLSAAPGIALFTAVEHASVDFSPALRALTLGCALASAYLTYGLTLVFVAPAANFALRCRLKAWRGSYYSAATVKWYVHNGLTYLVRFTFLDFITPTPLNILFFRMMGMEIGEGVQINTCFISDPSMISVGDRVTIGGSATIIGHYGVGGLLILAPVRIGAGATVGLRAIVMGGTEIGANAKILPNSVLLPKAKIPAGETWGGVPAQKIESRRAPTEPSMV